MKFLRAIFGSKKDAFRGEGKKSENWSWTLRSYGEHNTTRGGYPTEDAAVQALEEHMQSLGAGLNWEKDHPHLTVLVSGPGRLYSLGGRKVTITKVGG